MVDPSKVPPDQWPKDYKRLLAIEAARKRRRTRAASVSRNTQWFISTLNSTVRKTMKQRVRLATEFLRNRMVHNLSVPVTKEVSLVRISAKKWTTKVIVTERSKPGEFPRADTTRLMKDVFTDYADQSDSVHIGYVGMTLGYGLIHEIGDGSGGKRPWMLRTFNAEYSKVMAILRGPIGG